MKAYKEKSEFFEVEISKLKKELINKDAEISLLEKQLNKSNFDNDQMCKTNESLIIENKFMMEEIGNLKKILMKLDDWKTNLYNYLYKYDNLEKEILKSMLSDFPSFSELKEKFESLNSYHQRLNYQFNYNPKEYLLSSFNSTFKEKENNRNLISNSEKENIYSCIPQNNENNIDQINNESKEILSNKIFDERHFYSEDIPISVNKRVGDIKLDENKKKFNEIENQMK